MDEMITSIREVFVSDLQDLAWMDDETRKAAEEKVSFLPQVTTTMKLDKNHFIFVEPDLCVVKHISSITLKHVSSKKFPV